MSSKHSSDGQRPAGSGKRGKGPEREARLAAALRENLRKRKSQKNARRETPAPPPAPSGRTGA